ncbi:MAG: hypothetical protein CBC24_02605 [Candidatus Pelagibacter sp. TMED64]|nr:MAG: hypothetical protein CBC24_02605 [Candidatus Pelagibacter sp. TMED64]
MCEIAWSLKAVNFRRYELLMKVIKFSKISPWVAICVCLPAIALFSVVSRASDNESDYDLSALPAGTVNLVIGRAYVNSGPDGDLRLRTGASVSEGDRIRTESNGHVHIKFRDNAVLSVRPNSELLIESYRYNPEKPELSAVKLNLVQGTARTVSGEAAKAARERYRLNTPVAAIGVRGTDFLVSTTSSSLTALVNDGAIVVAPFSTQCSAQGLGPCSFNAVELGSDSMQALEFEAGMVQPRLIPVLSRAPESEQSLNLAGGLAALAQSILDQDAVATNQNDEVVAESVTSLELGDEAKVQAPYGTGFTPESLGSVSDLRDRQLVWGRFAEGKGDLERLTLPLSEAAEGRDVTVGGNFEYFLFRPEDGDKQVQEGLGEIGFSLTSAQAYFKAENQVSPVAVSGGGLFINFNNNSFQTSLDLYHMQLGEARFNSAGRIYNGGYFHSRDGESRIVGAVSLDGEESGYFFDFFNWDGLVQGITLWDAE